VSPSAERPGTEPPGVEPSLQPLPTPAAALLEAMASTPTKVYIRGKAGCEEWVLTGAWGDTLERIRLQRVVGTFTVRGARRRQRIERSFAYMLGHIVDGDARARYEDVWDVERRRWKLFREDLSQNACSDLFKATIEGDGSIALGHHRWYRTEATCKAAAAPLVVASEGCTGPMPHP
jgi:hypothetical protein